MAIPGNTAGRSLTEAAAFGPGSLVAGYRLEQQVGQGGMAVVFRARDERLGRLVALKILAPALAADETFRQRFVRESRAAAAVDDPHIVPVFEAGEARPGQHGGVLFIAMRYVPGGDVRGLMRREGRLAPPRAVAIISPVASALDAAHRAGLVHRDVKPANMLVDTQAGRPDHVYLSDFGLSKRTLASSGPTGAGQFAGTVDYISPEQIEGKPVDGRADQYALACATFELLAGAPPFRREGAVAVMYAQLSEPPPLLTAQRPDLPPATDDVFARALAKAPAERYASCRDFADALRAAFGLASYDSGPGFIPAAGHRPAQLTACAAAAAAGPPAGEGIARPAGHSPARSGPGARGEGQPARHSGPRRHALTTLSGIGVLVLASITATVILMSSPAHRSASSPPRPRVHPAAAATAQRQVTPPATHRPATRLPATPAPSFRASSASAPSPGSAAPGTPAPASAHPAAPTPTASAPATPTPTPTSEYPAQLTAAS